LTPESRSVAKKQPVPPAARPAKPKPKPVAKKPLKPKAETAVTETPAAGGQVRVYTLAVSLLNGPITRQFAKKNRSVVRTIQIRGDQTLEQLHAAIFAAFDREDEHMYEFQMGKGPMDPDGPRYVLPMAVDDDFGPPVAGTVDVTTLDAMGLEEGRQFGYWFDFGDDWHHQIGVEKVEDGPVRGKYPRVTERIGESPPQYVDWDDEE
jgi:Plasmid pRiA4b ORF-3-like protein